MKKAKTIKEIKVSKEVYFLRTALNMSGIAINYMATELILLVQNKMAEMGDQFDLKTASELEEKVKQKYKTQP